eukprot:4641172-Prymnesium_polylepis.1
MRADQPTGLPSSDSMLLSDTSMSTFRMSMCRCPPKAINDSNRSNGAIIHGRASKCGIPGTMVLICHPALYNGSKWSRTPRPNGTKCKRAHSAADALAIMQFL